MLPIEIGMHLITCNARHVCLNCGLETVVGEITAEK